MEPRRVASSSFRCGIGASFPSVSFSSSFSGVCPHFLLKIVVPIRYHCSNGLRKLFCNEIGSRYLLVDDHDGGYIFNGATDECLPVARFPVNVTHAFVFTAETADAFVCATEKSFTTFVYCACGRKGPIVDVVLDPMTLASKAVPLETARPKSFEPVALIGSSIYGQASRPTL